MLEVARVAEREGGLARRDDTRDEWSEKHDAEPAVQYRPGKMEGGHDEVEPNGRASSDCGVGFFGPGSGQHPVLMYI
jgi:hypothetical protein